jgi:hypothetical protein
VEGRDWTESLQLKGRMVSRALSLDLFGAPTSICLTHVLWWLDRWDEFKGNIGDSDEADDRACNYTENVAVEENGTDEDIDCMFC